MIGKVHKLKLEGKFQEVKIGTAANLYLPYTPFLTSPVPLGLSECVVFLSKNFDRPFWKTYNEFTEARACMFQTEHSLVAPSSHPVSHGFSFSLPKAWHNLLMSKILKI